MPRRAKASLWLSKYFLAQAGFSWRSSGHLTRYHGCGRWERLPASGRIQSTINTLIITQQIGVDISAPCGWIQPARRVRIGSLGPQTGLELWALQLTPNHAAVSSLMAEATTDCGKH